jgi:hypothetical protein
MFLNCLRNCILIIAGLLAPAVAMGAVDITKPALVSVAFAPGSVDVSATEQSIGITVAVADNGPGVQDIYCNLRSPTGRQNLGLYMGPGQLVSGTPIDGVFNTSQTLGVCAESGTWTLSSITVQDQCGNTTVYGPKAGATTLAYPPGMPTALVVTNTNAAQPLPGVTGFSYTPGAVAICATNTVTVTITGTNIASGNFTFVSPSGDNTAGGSFTSADETVPGTFTTSFTMGVCSEKGTWTLQSISVSNGDDSTGLSCGENVTYVRSHFPAGITQTTLPVSNPGYSVSTPELEAVWLESSTVDVSNGPITANVYVRAQDDTSGIAYGSGIYENAAGDMLELEFSNPEPGVIFSGDFQGTINIGACAAPGLYTLRTFTVNSVCGGETVYGPGKSAFPKGVLPSGFTVVDGAAAEGSLDVTIAPEDAIYNGAEWYLDDDGSQLYSSGEVVFGIAAGSHTIDFIPVYQGLYTPPAELQVNVNAGQTTYATGTYTPNFSTDAIQVNLVPAIIGGQWCVDFGPLQPSGATVTGLTDGSHTITFTDVNGFVAAQTQIVTTGGGQTLVTTGTYSQNPGIGALRVTLEPPGAANEGCTWSIDGGSQLTSGAIVKGLTAGPHTINFNAPNGSDNGVAPTETAYAIAGGTSAVTGTFPAISGSGSLMVTVTPGALSPYTRWYLTGGTEQKIGATLKGLPEGTYTVNFTTFGGFYTPPPQTVNVEPDETLAVSGTYIQAPPYVGQAERYAGLASSGTAYFTMVMNATGNFTGKLLTAPSGTYVLSGSLNATGSFQGMSLGSNPVEYSLQVTGTSAAASLATMTVGSNIIVGYPAAFVPTARGGVGKDTMLLSVTAPSIGVPQGVGYANATFAEGGTVNVAGNLGDGTAFSASSFLVDVSDVLEIFLFDPSIYGGQGVLSGNMVFSRSGTPFTGNLQWEKPPTTGSYYAGGFQTNLAVAGDYYRITKAAAFSSTLTFSGGVLPEPVVQPFDFAANGTVTVGTTTFRQISISINAATGAVTGYFRPAPYGAPVIPFSALILKDPHDPRAAGYFVGPVLSGTGLAGSVTLP